MKEFIELSVGIDLEEIFVESGDIEEAFEMLNYRLERKRNEKEKELEDKYKDLKVEFKDRIEEMWEDSK